MYKVIFNGDYENYEIFEDYASAKRFADRYGELKIVMIPCISSRNKKA